MLSGFGGTEVFPAYTGSLLFRAALAAIVFTARVARDTTALPRDIPAYGEVQAVVMPKSRETSRLGQVRRGCREA